MDDLPYAIAMPDTQGGLTFLHSLRGDRYYTLRGALRYPTFREALDASNEADIYSDRPRTRIIVNINQLRRHIA